MKDIKIILPVEILDWLEAKAKAENKDVNQLIQNYLMAGLSQGTQCLSKSNDTPPCSPNDPAP